MRRSRGDALGVVMVILAVIGFIMIFIVWMITSDRDYNAKNLGQQTSLYRNAKDIGGLNYYSHEDILRHLGEPTAVTDTNFAGKKEKDVTWIANHFDNETGKMVAVLVHCRFDAYGNLVDATLNVYRCEQVETKDLH